MTQAYPLHWPDGWARTTSRGSSRFKSTIHQALNNVQDELRRFANDSGKKIENLVISSNVTLGEQRPKDPGVAVYFNWDGISTCICVDRYEKVEDNLQAISHCIEAERTKLRHGGLNLVRAAFRGYAALPPPSGRAWHDILEVKPDSPMSVIEANYRRLAKDHHPDRPGGNQARMAEINAAFERAKKEKTA